MASFSAESLLEEVSPDEPCGPDMEYEAVFQEMERAAEGKPEQQMGDSIVEAEEPDWRTVKKNALDILAASKDLRAAAYLTHAALNIDGWTGFATGLRLIEGLIRQYWETVHPLLDPDDDNDPTMRVNILNGLSAAEGVLRSCHRVPVVAAKGLGAYCQRDFDIAAGVISAPSNYDGEPPNAAMIEAVFMQAELDDIVATAETLTAARNAVDGINQAIAERIPLTETPDLDPLTKLLNQVLGEVNSALQRRGVATEGSEEAEGAEAGGTSQPQAGISGTVQSRDDVVRVIDQICEFYRRSEPSSPVPILLQRARKLVDMDFMDIVRNLAPGGLSDAESIRGPQDD